MTKPSYSKERFKELISKEPSGFIAAQAADKNDRDKKLRSFKVALSVLEILEHKKMSQSTLAVNMGVTPQTISKWLKGKSNMTLETIEKLEKALGYKIIEIRNIDFDRESRNVEFVMKKMNERTIKVKTRKQDVTEAIVSKDDYQVRRSVKANTFNSMAEANKNLRPTG